MDANSNPNPLSMFGQPTPSVAPEFQGFGHPTESTPSLFAPVFQGFGQPQSSFPSMFGGVPLEDKVADSANNLLESYEYCSG